MVYIALAVIAFLIVGMYCCMVAGKWADKVLGYEGEEEE